MEIARGLEGVKGTFAGVFAEAVVGRTPPEAIAALLERLRIRPVITAHPTEAKRVTVLEKHRRIYRRLVDLESPRWTPRERRALMDQLRDEIDLLWMTGELRLEKPTVPQEVYWGLHFFQETLFDAVPETAGRLELALAQFYPGVQFNVAPFFQFGSWVGGDRDGNPFVTNEVTRNTLNENRVASPAALPAAADGTGAAAEHLGSRGAGVAGVPGRRSSARWKRAATARASRPGTRARCSGSSSRA